MMSSSAALCCVSVCVGVCVLGFISLMQRLCSLFPQPARVKVNGWSSRLEERHLCLLSSSRLTL